MIPSSPNKNSTIGNNSNQGELGGFDIFTQSHKNQSGNDKKSNSIAKKK